MDSMRSPSSDSKSLLSERISSVRRLKGSSGDVKIGKPTDEPDVMMACKSQSGIHFTLGDADEGTEESIAGAISRPLFCEMEELRRSKVDGSMEWKETARWIKFEEDVEEGGGRWSKPFVAAMSLQSLLELRTYLSQGSMLLDIECPTLPALCDFLSNDWISRNLLQDYHRMQVRDLFLLRHRHQFEGLGDHKPSFALRQLSEIGRSISHGIFNMTHTELTAIPSVASTSGATDKEGDGTRKQSQPTVPTVTSSASVGSGNGIDSIPPNESRSNFHFSRKLPRNTESCTILVGELEFASRGPMCAFVRTSNNVCLGNLTEVAVPTRFIFVLLGSMGNAVKYREVGRAMGAMCSDEIFQRALYKAKSRKDVMDAVDEFMNEVTVLPPGEWDPGIRIEPPKTLPFQSTRKQSPNGSVDTGKNQVANEEPQIERTGRFFGGLIDDVKRKAPHYLNDFKDGIALQCLASAIFLYFATLTPVVAFGAVLGVHTDNNMAALESILSAAMVGILWALFSGQPLTIMGSTGPVLVFESIVTTTCRQYDLDYLSVRFWIGLWTGLFLFIMVATDASYLVRYITRFTEEGFAALISFIFIFESLEKLYGISKTRNICIYPMDCPSIYEQCSCNISNELVNIQNASRAWCTTQGGSLTGPGCSYVPDVFLFSIVLFCGTFFLASHLKNFRSKPYFPATIRQVVSDFSVIASIILMTLIDLHLGLDTPKLRVPHDLTPTNPGRSWLVHPFGRNPTWTCIAAIIPALFAVILIFMDQQITAVIVNRRENKLKKGFGYHLDLFVLTLSVILCSLLGLPWMVAATVLSINHVNSLKLESECKAPGEPIQFTGVRENRLTTLCIYLLIGASCFMTPLLSRIPLPVLYGVFLFMGVSALRGLQFVERLKIILMPPKYQPDFVYLRHVPIKRIHFFTSIQTVCLVLLWVLKSFDESSILFPLMVLALVGVRKLMDFVFRQSELALLDDLMPEMAMRKKEDGVDLDLDLPSVGPIDKETLSTSINGGNPNHTFKEELKSVPTSIKPSKPSSWRKTETAENKSLSSKRLVKTEKKLDSQGQPLIPKNSFLSKLRQEKIVEENEVAIPFPVITVSPATPQSARSVNLLQKNELGSKLN